MGYIFIYLISAFFGIAFLLGSAPITGTALVISSCLVLANQPSDRTIIAWLFLFALIGIVIGHGYYGSAQY